MHEDTKSCDFRLHTDNALSSTKHIFSHLYCIALLDCMLSCSGLSAIDTDVSTGQNPLNTYFVLNLAQQFSKVSCT